MLDMDFLYREYGARAIYFREDNFGADRGRLLGLCRLLVGQNKVKWGCELRADIGSDEDVIEAMHLAGCTGMYVGAESGSDKILKSMNKKITVAQIIGMCRHAHKRRMNLALSFVDNFPGESQEDKKATEELISICDAKTIWRNTYREPIALYRNCETMEPRQCMNRWENGKGAF